ncbi:hypothetical protein HK101_000486, partial [Irineochytrium annulatum]
EADNDQHGEAAAMAAEEDGSAAAFRAAAGGALAAGHHSGAAKETGLRAAFRKMEVARRKIGVPHMKVRWAKDYGDVEGEIDDNQSFIALRSTCAAEERAVNKLALRFHHGVNEETY